MTEDRIRELPYKTAVYTAALLLAACLSAAAMAVPARAEEGFAADGLVTYGSFIGNSFQAPFHYRDAYFRESTVIYSDSLSTMSMCLAMSAFASKETEDYSLKSVNLRALPEQCGFDMDSFMLNRAFSEKPGTDTKGVGAEAVINLAAGMIDEGTRISDRFLLGTDTVYAYCFECPQGTVKSLDPQNVRYRNIFSIVNQGDAVTKLAPTMPSKQFGFTHYGIVLYIPCITAGSEERYREDEKKMLRYYSQLEGTEDYPPGQFRMKKIFVKKHPERKRRLYRRISGGAEGTVQASVQRA